MSEKREAACRFAATRWSIVLAVGSDDPDQAREALAALCESYWYPLYAYVRRCGHDPHDAQDLTQAFFAKLLDKDYLLNIRREGGRFRSFLVTALKRFLANEWDRERAAKRGGGKPTISLDEEVAESRYANEPVEPMTPEKLYERRWAQALLDRAFSRLRADYEREGRAASFRGLSPYLSRPKGRAHYAEAARHLGMTEAAIKMAVHRLRARYRDCLREEIAHTVSGAEEVEEEIRHLFAAFDS